MLKLLQDALELATLRVKPLSHYAYQYWQPALWLSLIGALPAFFDDMLKVDMPQRLLFWVLLIWIQALVVTAFFSWWLKLGERWKGDGSLFPLIVLVSSTELLEPFVSLLPDDLGTVMDLLVLIFQLIILVRALAIATGSGVKHVVTGLLIYLPTALLIFLMAFQVLVSLDWVVMPASTGEPL